MAINWEYDAELVDAVRNTFKEFNRRYEAACDGYTIDIDGLVFELSEEQQNMLRADVIEKWQAFQAAIDALEAHAMSG